VRPEAVPPAIPQRQGEAPRPFSGSLAQLLEHATVMIASAGPAGIGHGSGFFIAGDLVLTNAHVVQQADPNQIFVMSRAMGRAVKAQLVSMTRGPGGGPVEPGMPDFALLKLPEAVAGAQPLQHVSDGVLAQQHAAQHRLLGSEILRGLTAEILGGRGRRASLLSKVIDDGHRGYRTSFFTLQVVERRFDRPRVHGKLRHRQDRL
jgi:hypothetical protein